MNDTKHLYFVFILVLAILAFVSCATTRSTAVGNKSGAIETTPQIVDNLDYTGQRIDADISSAIKMKFAADELLSNSNINVDTLNRKVTLNGKVDTQAGEDRAIRLGRSVDGVRSVRSSLTVKSAKSK